MKKDKKKYENWKSREILNFWYEKFREINKEDYSHGDFIGKELKYFSELLDSYDVYALLMGIEKGIQNGEILIRYFNTNIEKYVPDTVYSKYFFLIEKFGPKNLKDKLVDLSVYETTWMPSAVTNRKAVELIKEFDVWLSDNDL